MTAPFEKPQGLHRIHLQYPYTYPSAYVTRNIFHCCYKYHCYFTNDDDGVDDNDDVDDDDAHFFYFDCFTDGD